MSYFSNKVRKVKRNLTSFFLLNMKEIDFENDIFIIFKQKFVFKKNQVEFPTFAKI